MGAATTWGAQGSKACVLDGCSDPSHLNKGPRVQHIRVALPFVQEVCVLQDAGLLGIHTELSHLQRYTTTNTAQQLL